MDVLDTVAPLKSIRLKRNDLPWVDQDMRELFVKRDKLHTLASGFKDKNHTIWNTYRELRNFCKSTLRRKMKSFFEEKSTKDFKSSKDFWKFYNKFVVKSKKSKDDQLISNIFDANKNKMVSEPVDVANAFNKFFTNIKGESEISLQESKDFINNNFRSYKSNNLLSTETFSIKPLSEAIVIETIKTLDNCSSCGISEIPVSVIKNSANFIAPVLTKIYNECILTGIIPKDFKCAIAFPLFKKGDSSSCDNYRGISVLSPFAKIFERLISHQITTFFTYKKIFSPEQHGFRSNHSCETALQTILDRWKKALERNENILALFIDFKKAFDLIDPELLFLKLFHYGFDNSSLKLIINYFFERTMLVKLGSTLSSKSELRLGVPQGSILGPLFFIIFINDLAIFSELLSILFADDTTLFDSSLGSLEELMRGFNGKFSKLYEWIKFNKLYINWSKTKLMIITKQVLNNCFVKSSECYCQKNKKIFYKPSFINLIGNSVEVVADFKLLGVTIDEKLNFETHVKLLRKKVNQKLFAIKKVFYLSFSIKLHFFKTFILPHFDYCSSLFLYFSNTLLDNLKGLYNNALFHLLQLNFRGKSIDEQFIILKPLNLLPFKYRILYRFSTFCYKILNKTILKNFYEDLIVNSNIKNTRSKSRNILVVPRCETHKSSKRLSNYLPLLVNNVLRYSYNLPFNYFKTFILFNISSLFLNFSSNCL